MSQGNVTSDPHCMNKIRVMREAGCNFSDITYLSTESYPAGMRNCCYVNVFQTPNGQYAVEYHCGCEEQTVPDGTKERFEVYLYGGE